MNLRIVSILPVALLAAAAPLFPQTPSSRTVVSTASEEPVQLSPFLVNTSGDQGWVASTTLSGNRTQENLSEVPITVFGMTGEFMRDLNVFTLEDASRWVAGIDVTSYQARRTDDQMTAYRGLTTGGRAITQSSRNFFSWFSPTDQYNIDRIDFNFGSNSLMYGDATAGGLPTTYTKVPQFTNFGTAFASYDNWGSYRLQLDINRKITDKLAIRINAVDRDTRSYINFDEDALRAITGAIIYKPFANTTVRAEYEGGLLWRYRSTDEDSIKSIAAPGKGYANTGWYLTSDGNIINNSATGTVAAVDKTASSGTNIPFLQGESVPVTLPGGLTQVYNGFNKKFNVLGVGDYINRPYKNASIWLDQNIGKLSLEASYNFEREVQERNDTDFGGTGAGGDAGSVINIDGSGRPYVDMVDPNPKVYNESQKTYRVSATYPFEFGHWMKQFLVANFSNEVYEFDTTRYNMANFAVENGATVPISANQIIFRAYLDSPDVYGRGFWSPFSFITQNLPHTTAFQPGYYYSSDPNAPWVDIHYQDTWAISSAGTYLNGKLHSLFGIRTDEVNRKRITTPFQPNDAIGQAIFLGGPNVVPQDYTYDPEIKRWNPTETGGLEYNLFNMAGTTFNIFTVYSRSYDAQAFEKWNDEDLGPLAGEDREVGFKGDTLDHLLTYSVSFYRNYKRGAAYAWTNPSGFTTTGVGAANSMQTLFNPIGLAPTDPSYFTVASGANSEDHTTSANEKAKGVEFTLQLQRHHGFMVLLDGAYNQLSANRDFSDFQARLNAALARQAQYIAAGQPGYAQSLITGAQTLLGNNLGLSDESGQREKPYSANLVVDYAFNTDNFLKGVELGVGLNYQSKYHLVTTVNGDLDGDSEMPLDLYLIYERKIFRHPVFFRLGVTHAWDLENLHEPYRTVGITTNPTPGVPAVYQYAYFPQPTVNFMTVVSF